VANRKRVRRLMRVMGLEAIYQKPNTSRKHPGHKVYPDSEKICLWGARNRSEIRILSAS
jgi:hypothetical protein